MQISSKLQGRVHEIVESKFFVLISTMFTLYRLFGLDIKMIAFNIDSTTTFDILTILSFVFFTIEIILESVGNPRYLNSFFFYLDVVATSTLILDISSVSAGLVSGSLSKASRAIRAGTPVRRVIRVIQLIRLLRISKLLKAFLKKRSELEEQHHDDEAADVALLKSSKRLREENELGKQLSKLTSTRVVVLVLLMVFVISQLDVGSQFTIYESVHLSGLGRVHQLYQNFVDSCRQGNATNMGIERHRYERQLQLLLLETCTGLLCKYDYTSKVGWIGAYISDPNDTCMIHANSPSLTGKLESPLFAPLKLPWDENCDPSLLSTSGGISLSADISCPSRLRPAERTLVSSRSSPDDKFFFEIVVDSRGYASSEAILSIIRTLVICAILGIGALAFSQDAFTLVLEPIERMIQMVETIRQNPLMATRIDDSSTKRNEMEKTRRLAIYNTATNPVSRWLAKRELAKLNQTSLETVMLEKTIVRIGGLLAVGFGQAGAEIVAQNMTSTGSGITAMIPGKRIDAIFVSIRIQNFSVIASVLQDKVMLFVNQVCEIVHGVTDEFNGMANRNNGDAFLMVWRLTNSSHQEKMYDMAVAACAKISIAVGRSLELNEYRSLPPLMQKIKDFRVALSFGMHKGWAIEGAIGSNLKIDPSYLGPDVNVAETLDKANMDYGTCILASDTVVRSCSPQMREMFRRVDRIHLRSARNAFYVYSFDLDMGIELLTQYEIDNLVITQPSRPADNRNVGKYKQRIDRERRKTLKLSQSMPQFLNEDKYFLLLRNVYQSDKLFCEKFRNGFLNYEAGEWEIARLALTETATALRRVAAEDGLVDNPSALAVSDGPSNFLLSYMQRYEFVPQPGWRGIREL